MGAARPGAFDSAQSSLRQVFALGEDLLCLAQRAAAQDLPAGEIFAAQRALIESTVEELTGGRAHLWLVSPDFHRAAGKHLQAQALRDLTPLALRSLETHQAVFSSNGSLDDDDGMQGLPGRPTAQALAVPLSIHDRQAGHSHLLGVLQVERLNRPPFTLQEVELVEGLAAQAALALHANLSLASERWRLRLLTLVRQVSLQVLDLRDLDEIARRITQLIRQTFDYYYVAIFTLTAGQDTLHLRASAGPQETQAEGEAHSPVLTVEPGQGLIGYVAQAGQEIVANDVHAEPRFRYLDSLPETRSEVVLPLAAQDRLLGVLDVQSDQPGDFDDTDMLVLRALAGNIAIAIHSAQLYKALHQRASQLAAVYEVSSALTSILDQEKLLDEVVDLIHKRFGYPYVHLYTVHPGRRKVFYEAGSGARSQEPGLGEIAYDLDDPLGLIPWVARHGETALANDVSQDARYRALYSPDDTRAELTVPLIFGNQVLGILDVQSNRAEAFGEEDRFLFEALAGHIAIAMRNAHLYQSEIWRRQVADSLREGAGLLSADIDLDQALEAILAELERTLPLDVAAIWLLDEYGGLDAAEEGPPALHLAAVRGPCVAELDIETGLSPEDLLLYNGFASPAQAPEPPISAWLHQALSAEQPVIRADHSPFDPLGVMLQFPADYSAIAAPLRVGDQPRGLLVLAHRTAGRYGSEARAMTAAFASYAAVAIENARLYEEAHEQAWVSTVLLQVAEATQSLTDLNELLATVIRITPMLAGVKACLLYILDDDGDFIPAAATGLPPGQQQEFERWRFAPGDVPALDRLVLDRQPLILHNRADDQRLAGILRPAQPVSPSHETNLAVLVPVLARGEVLGAFLVDYSLSIASHSGKPLDAFFDERLAILQGIAHQTAIAVDNIRLLKAQKEEAYVSVALLQVAQAVVSSSDLDETLGSIVRITPILVGVKRALVYLWNENQRAFHLSQAYGVARAAEARQFAPGEFPLLDAVLIEGELLACPLWDEIAASDQVPEVWAGLAAPEPQIVSQYLENAACLLIALPLSVKGKVLGVFLVEEPEPTPREGFSSVNANRRLREKRLEIITGISQQAALAIQNEQLQRETVERERLEREMQLAREIQRAFVPQSLPKLPGWELEVCWCLAREVGGDFYDVFDLPGNRLALVIADVADKGMPAALFMTLARTLLRATVQEIDSPAESLERVNNIIVPEATSGMFVTIFYAVLDLDTGELEYANAGHNLPVILRARTQQIELLERCGMALGVLENNRIHNRKILLETGDCLVMYTDGITEAFSLEYEPFGEARLLQIILDFAHPEAAGDQAPGTAQNLLDTINRAVQNFVGEASLSDDQTILVLKRD